MNVICSICSDQLEPTDDIFYTRCGHVFHLNCLNPWLERSKSCPQCREKVTQNKIHRLYFTFASNEVVESQASTLQERIDSLKFQMLLKEKDIQYYTSKCVTLEKQNAGLRQEVYKVEGEVNQKNAAIHALKEQIEYFKKRSSYCDSLKKEIAQLHNKIEELEPIQVLLNGPLSDVRKMIGNSKDPETLTKYISVMKKELITSFNKCKKLRMTISSLREELNAVTTKCNALLKEQSDQMGLERELSFPEDKSIDSQKEDDELEETYDVNISFNNTSKEKKVESKNDISKNLSVEVEMETDKSNKERTGKYVIPKRKVDKISMCKNKSEDNNECRIQNIPIESDSNNSDTDLTNYKSSAEFSTVSKRFKMSDANINISDQNNSMSKKKRKHVTKKKISDTLDTNYEDDSSVIDLT